MVIGGSDGLLPPVARHALRIEAAARCARGCSPMHPGCDPMHPGCDLMYPGCDLMYPGARRLPHRGAATHLRRAGAALHLRAVLPLCRLQAAPFPRHVDRLRLAGAPPTPPLPPSLLPLPRPRTAPHRAQDGWRCLRGCRCSSSPTYYGYTYHGCRCSSSSTQSSARTSRWHSQSRATPPSGCAPMPLPPPSCACLPP